MVRSEPYRLASEVWGIGFQDRGHDRPGGRDPARQPQRIKAWLQYTLSQAADNGHCYLPEPDLIRDAAKILEIDQRWIDPCLDGLAAEEGVVREPVPARADVTGGSGGRGLSGAVSPCRALSRGWDRRYLLNASQERLPAFAAVDWQKALGWLRKPGPGRTSRPAKQEAVKLALTNKVAVLTGGPGCGKSFTIRSVVEARHG